MAANSFKYILLLLLIVFLLVNFTAKAQIRKGSCSLSGDLYKNNVNSTETSAGSLSFQYHFLTMVSLGITVEKGAVTSNEINSSLFSSRKYYSFTPSLTKYFHGTDHNFWFLQLGYTRLNEKQQFGSFATTFPVQENQIFLQLGVLFFLHENLALEVVPLKFYYRESASSISGVSSVSNTAWQREQKIKMFKAAAAPEMLAVSLRFYAFSDPLPGNFERIQLTDKKNLSGSVNYQNERIDSLNYSRMISFSPSYGVFICNWAETGIGLGVQGKKSKLNLNNGFGIPYVRNQVEYNFQFIPYLKFYKWLSSNTALFVKPFFGSQIVYKEYSEPNLEDEYFYAEATGGVNIGVSSFFTKRLMVEGQIPVYTYNPLHYGFQLSTVKLSLSFVLSAAE